MDARFRLALASTLATTLACGNAPTTTTPGEDTRPPTSAPNSEPPASVPDPSREPSSLPHAATEVVLFEDNVVDGDEVPSLVYRIEDGLHVSRSPGRPGTMRLEGGPAALVHPAAYVGATVFVHATIRAGALGVRIGHNGMTTIAGAPNQTPGYEVRFGRRSVDVMALASDTPPIVVARFDTTIELGVETELAVSFQRARRSLAIDLPGGRHYEVADLVIPLGGFGLATTDETDVVDVSRVRAVWGDTRPSVLYDGYDTLYNLSGQEIERIPSVGLFPNQTYVTLSVDSVTEKSLIRYQDSRTGAPHGYAVRDLRTGAMDLLSGADGLCNGLHMAQGGSSFDGLSLHANYDQQKLTWFRWARYHAGLRDRLCEVDDHVGFGSFTAPTSSFLAYADPSVALDGSMARVVRLDSSWQGVTHLIAPPELRPYVTWHDRALPGPSNAMASQTGPGGLVGFAVRDADRLVYEEWSYVRYWEPSGGSNLHLGNFGFNLFTGKTDFLGPQRGWQRGLPTTNDFANMLPSFTRPGKMLGFLYEFDDAVSGGGRFKSAHWTSLGRSAVTPETSLSMSSAVEILYRPTTQR